MRKLAMQKENSHALPAHRYGNPADVVEFDQLRRLGCKVCKSFKVVLGRGVCGDARNAFQKGVPGVGHRCKWFAEKG